MTGQDNASEIETLRSECARLRAVCSQARKALRTDAMADPVTGEFSSRTSAALVAISAALGDVPGLATLARPASGPWSPDIALLDQLRQCIGKSALPTSEHDGKTSRLHLWSMLDRMEAFTSIGKFNRWVGYIQGVLVATGNGTVDQFKDMNRVAPPAAGSQEG